MGSIVRLVCFVLFCLYPNVNCYCFKVPSREFTELGMYAPSDDWMVLAPFSYISADVIQLGSQPSQD